MCKVKTTVLLLLIIFEIMLVFRYSIEMKAERFYAIVLDAQQFIVSIIYFQLCYFYAKKAAHFIDDCAQVLKIMRAFMYFNLAGFVCFMIWQISSYDET